MIDLTELSKEARRLVASALDAVLHGEERDLLTPQDTGLLSDCAEELDNTPEPASPMIPSGAPGPLALEKETPFAVALDAYTSEFSDCFDCGMGVYSNCYEDVRPGEWESFIAWFAIEKDAKAYVDACVRECDLRSVAVDMEQCYRRAIQLLDELADAGISMEDETVQIVCKFERLCDLVYGFENTDEETTTNG